MKKKLLLIVVLVILLPSMTSEVKGPNGYEIVAVFGSVPTIDGNLYTAEWSDADNIVFNNTAVNAKQDGVNLYIGVSSAYFSVQEPNFTILIDVEHDGSATLQSDDIAIWIYRNGTMGEAKVTSGEWITTAVSGWTAVSGTGEFSWRAEFNVTYSKINVVAGVEKTIGIAFLRTRDLNPDPYTWPPNHGQIIENPSNWGDMTSTGYNWIPEITSFLILSLFMLSTLLATIVYRRKIAIQGGPQSVSLTHSFLHPPCVRCAPLV
jgi:hypothetical protein